MSYSNTPNNKLTNIDVLKIRELLAEGGSQKEISLLYKVTQSLISRINSRYYWNHI